MKTATAVKDAQPDLLGGDTPKPEVITPTKEAKVSRKNAVAVNDAAVPAAPTPMDMLNHAVTTGAGLDVVERLMTLQERWEANQARKAFVEAFAAFKSEAIAVIRNKTVTDGPLKGKSYAELFSFVDAVTPALSKHGLSASWNITKDEKDWIEVTCTIEHVLGHSRQVPMGGPPDAGGAKNAIQARASTVTYLERHTLKAACGIAEQGDDKDGNVAGNKASTKKGDAVVLVTEKQAKEIAAAIEFCGVGLERFCKHYHVEKIDQLPAERYREVMKSCNDFAEKSAKS